MPAPSTRGVHDPYPGLHLREQIRTDQAHRVGRLGQVDRDEVSLCDEILER
jgi:hypothetical protein